MDDDNTGWTYDMTGDGAKFRFRVRFERVDSISEPYRATLVQDANRRAMTLHEYVGWVAGMQKKQLHAYRDKVRTGEGGDGFYELYQAWLHARIAVREEEDWLEGYPPGTPGSWLKEDLATCYRQYTRTDAQEHGMGLFGSRKRFYAIEGRSDYRIFDKERACAVMERVPNNFYPAKFATLTDAERVASHLNAKSYPRRHGIASFYNEHYCKVEVLGRIFLVDGEYELDHNL